MQLAQADQGKVMRGFRVEPEQQGAQQGVEVHGGGGRMASREFSRVAPH